MENEIRAESWYVAMELNVKMVYQIHVKQKMMRQPLRLAQLYFFLPQWWMSCVLLGLFFFLIFSKRCLYENTKTDGEMGDIKYLLMRTR